MSDDGFLLAGEIAAALRVHPSTVRRWIDKGELAAVRPSERVVRVSAAEYQRFIITKGAVGGAGVPELSSCD